MRRMCCACEVPRLYLWHHLWRYYSCGLELCAVDAAADELTPKNMTHLIAIVTDVKLVLEALQPKNIHSKNICCPKCIKSTEFYHCGFAGNKRADKLVKKGTTKQQSDVPITRKKIMMNTQRLSHRCSQNDYYLLDKSKSSFSNKMGHNILFSHVYSEFKTLFSYMHSKFYSTVCTQKFKIDDSASVYIVMHSKIGTHSPRTH